MSAVIVRLFPLVAGFIATGLIAAPGATAAPEVLIPSGVTQPALPGTTISYSAGVFTPAKVAVLRPSSVTWAGTLPTFDATSGFSPLGIGVYGFQEAGAYVFHATPAKQYSGTLYVVGPRAMLDAAFVTAADGPYVYNLDASGSYVVDFAASSILSYAFDTDGDGTFDRVGTSPTTQIALATPGEYPIGVRVTDDQGRTDDQTLNLHIPRPTAAPPAAPAPVDPGPGVTQSGPVLTSRSVTILIGSSARRSLIRKNGLAIRVRRLQAGDTARVVLRAGKKRLTLKRFAGTGGNPLRLMRVRLSSSAARYVTRKRPKSVLVSVTVTGTDGLRQTKRKAVRLRA